MREGASGDWSLFLCGDVMTGRGIDQAMRRPVPPKLFESWISDAREYIALAEERHGPIPRPISPEYPWGESLAELERASVDLRLINLETSITSSDQHCRDKGIHYRMHPRNIDCLAAAEINVCSLANNHTLDWGREGLRETLTALKQKSIATAGAGCNAEEAQEPAVLFIPGKGRLLFFACAAMDSGVPDDWAATKDRAGLHVLDDLSETRAQKIYSRLQQVKSPGDIAVMSIHWGGNWGYDISRAQRKFARHLIDGGFDIVHGHSSHHALPCEIYRGRLILYGCGDFINDYEGITGHEAFRGDLSIMYLARLNQSGELNQLRMVPFRMQRFRLARASRQDSDWLCGTFKRLGRPFGTGVTLCDDGALLLETQGSAESFKPDKA